MRDALLPIPTFDSQLPWFALQVNSRKENWIFAHLVGQGYECFLPKYKSVRQWSDRRKEIESPLFPGYLFCRFNPLERLPILKTPGVMEIVGCNRKPIAIDEQEIQAIQRMMESSLVRQPWPYLEVGQQVRIQSGALLIRFNQEGHRVLSARKGRNLQLIGKAASNGQLYLTTSLIQHAGCCRVLIVERPAHEQQIKLTDAPDHGAANLTDVRTLEAELVNSSNDFGGERTSLITLDK